MDSDPLEHYRENLWHVVRPELSEERDTSMRLGLRDHEALYLRRGLQEFVSYGSGTKEEKDIALAYIEYIDMVVREERKTFVYLYTHTEEAAEVLKKGIDSIVDVQSGVHKQVELNIDAVLDSHERQRMEEEDV